MRTINGAIMSLEPFDCPAGYAMADCIKCIYRFGSVRASPEKGVMVRCDWDEHEEQKEEDDE